MKASVAEHLCPSAPAEPGALLLGLIGDDGRLQHLGTPMAIDASFIESARSQGGLLGKRFRFSSPCRQGECGHWASDACGLIGRLQDAAATSSIEVDSTLPRCIIRKDCRWWQQSGREACGVCTFVARE